MWQGLIPALEAKDNDPKISSSQLSLVFTLQRRQECCPSLLQETPVGEKQNDKFNTWKLQTCHVFKTL